MAITTPAVPFTIANPTTMIGTLIRDCVRQCVVMSSPYARVSANTPARIAVPAVTQAT